MGEAVGEAVGEEVGEAVTVPQTHGVVLKH